MANGESFSSSVEMDVLESTVTDLHDDSINGSVASSLLHSTVSSSNRSSQKRFKKQWERPCNLQEKARQERLNMSRNRKGEDSLNVSNQAANGIYESSDDIVPPEPLLEDSSVNDVDVDNKEPSADSDVSEQDDADSSECVALESAEGKDVEDNCKENSAASDSIPKASRAHDTTSDHFGGSDKSSMVDRARKSVSGSNYKKPFVCTYPTGNNKYIMKSATQSISSAEDTVLLNMCEKSLQLVKARRNSIIVPIGTLQFGVCRHRALTWVGLQGCATGENRWVFCSRIQIFVFD
ncbi:Armadillo repeat-containing protein 3 and Serine/threonine-protein kinase CTR1 [Artemisia annua]|uniref:Armadillo repeat-containing protein 3 and Serine/threonine-protein kinase CTR1 n=1 Tax=Artemisia annua TaxID=35608 RepID=A0A2U1PA36_ARTAN|nr:Armadillo repeat-containing protein 3 and Serine/threonine-protein kinase CTR1 [Artemisia annua]